MKLSIAVTFLYIVSTLTIYAQQNDTIKISIPSQSTLQLKDSLLPDKSNFKIKSLDPDYIYFDKPFREPEENKMTFEFDNTNKQVNFFNSSYSKYIIPTALIFYGIITRESETLQKFDQRTHYEVSEHLKAPIPIDDYSQFAPTVAVYGLDFLGVKARHNFRDRTIIMATSYMIMGATVQTMKKTIDVWRPDGSCNNSFPSGHTATAFVGAHILFKEYKDASPWIGIAGYTVAAGTGALRVLNKRHWVSDVVTGAGIGILSAEAGYMLLPVFHKVLGIKDTNKNLVIVPTIGTNNYGIGMAYTF